MDRMGLIVASTGLTGLRRAGSSPADQTGDAPGLWSDNPLPLRPVGVFTERLSKILHDQTS